MLFIASRKASSTRIAALVFSTKPPLRRFPMHPHGHTMLVLSRNGVPSSGSPWWTDTLNVAPGEVYEVALRADNPGLWMDHCHNLDHAAAGMVMHVAYRGVTSPFELGGTHGNSPE